MLEANVSTVPSRAGACSPSSRPRAAASESGMSNLCRKMREALLTGGLHNSMADGGAVPHAAAGPDAAAVAEPAAASARRRVGLARPADCRGVRGRRHLHVPHGHPPHLEGAARYASNLKHHLSLSHTHSLSLSRARALSLWSRPPLSLIPPRMVESCRAQTYAAGKDVD
jgi:hypothetical protein